MELSAVRWSRKTPVILQTEAAECGLACLAMVAGHHGHDTDLGSLRNRTRLSMQGARLNDLMQVAAQLGLTTRALRAEPEALPSVGLPAVLHVDFNHFVVLSAVRGSRFIVHDPALGRRVWNAEELSRRFTGVVLEAAPNEGFVAARTRQRASLRTLIGPIRGLVPGVVQALGLAVALEIFALAAPFYMQWVIDDVVVSADRDLLVVLAAGFAMLVVFQVIVTALRAWVLTLLGIHLNLAMTRRLFSHLVRLPMRYFASRSLGDVNSRFESLNAVQGTLTGGAMSAVIDGVMSVALLVMMFVFSPLLCGVVVLTAALYAILRLATYRPLRTASEEQIVRRGKRDSHFLETLRGMQSVKLFGAQVLRCGGFQNLMVAEFNAGLRVQRLQVVFKAMNGALFGLENIAVIGLAAHLILDGGFTAGMLLAFMAYKQQFVSRVAGLIETMVALKMLDLHRERIGDIALCETEDAVEVSGHACPDSNDIVADNVSFAYADNTPDILKATSLEVGAGESVACVGPSGCGKTTLMKLMLGLLNPSEGEVRIGGVPFDRIDPDWRRSNIAAVMQDDQLFAGSLYDNVAFFDPQVDRARVEECARLAAVHQDIAALAMGYHTLVGDMGSVLSGGQKQRLLLARALYRRPKILLLDEATSHLDVAREREVNAAIRDLAITRIIVAHRPETIASADRVIVLGGAAGGVAPARHHVPQDAPATPVRATRRNPWWPNQRWAPSNSAHLP